MQAIKLYVLPETHLAQEILSTAQLKAIYDERQRREK